MEQYVKARYNDDILHAIMGRYAIPAGTIHELDGFESFIYEFNHGDESRILRVAHSDRRSVALIQGEVEWINYLAAGGASVARAVLSENHQLVETVADQHGGHFLATAFMKAPGKLLSQSQWDADLFERYGRLLGRMHALTKSYQPSDPSWKRPEWNDEALMLNVAGWLPASEHVAQEKFQQLMEHLTSLPKDDQSYGLIHQDAHGGNFFVDQDGTITLFDFDDCVYGWFVYDIAIVLFYAAMWQDNMAAFTAEFMTHFLRGYWQENQIDITWFKQIPPFLKLREIDLYAIIHRDFDVENLDDPWNIGYMNDRKAKIENDVPYINFDFASLAQNSFIV